MRDTTNQCRGDFRHETRSRAKALPSSIARLVVSDFKNRIAVGTIELLQDVIANMGGVHAGRFGAAGDKLGLSQRDVAFLQQFHIRDDVQAPDGPTVEGMLFVDHGVLNDVTREYWRS
jgi:hypothetical protein